MGKLLRVFIKGLVSKFEGLALIDQASIVFKVSSMSLFLVLYNTSWLQNCGASVILFTAFTCVIFTLSLLWASVTWIYEWYNIDDTEEESK